VIKKSPGSNFGMEKLKGRRATTAARKTSFLKNAYKKKAKNQYRFLAS